MPVLMPPQTGLHGYILYPIFQCAALDISVGTVRAYPSEYGTLPPLPAPSNPNGTSNDFVFMLSTSSPDLSAGDDVTFDLIASPTGAPKATNVQKT